MTYSGFDMSADFRERLKNTDLSIYIHIPFCAKKCAYCDFLSFTATEDIYIRYFEKLLCEIEENASVYRDYVIKTVFFGGGTPSVISAGYIDSIIEKVYELYKVSTDAEISIEVNPKTVDIDKLRIYKKAGINRLSIGGQSLDDNELKLLGRIHSENDFYMAYESARAAGFDNINVDIMSALPGQSLEAYIKGLKKLLMLNPEHISAYSLIIEEGTSFYERFHSDVEIREKGGVPKYLPDENEERSMIYRGRKILIQAGYAQYEISNYARPGFECRHNITYWKRGNYAGFGLGAASCVDECRWKNTEVLSEYMSAGSLDELKRDVEKLTFSERLSEAMFLGLRLTKGVDTAWFSKRYGIYPKDAYGDWIKKMIDEGLLEMSGMNLLLTERGQDLANYVMAGFV